LFPLCLPTILMAMVQRFFLLLKNQRLPIDIGSQYLIGRGPDCQILLTDPSVSRQHAQLRWIDDTWQIQDLNSSNGIYLNGKRILSGQLKHGNIIRLGKSEINFIHLEMAPLDGHLAMSPNDTSNIESKMAALQEKISDPDLWEQFEEIRRLIQGKKDILTDLAYRDELTGLYNRRRLDAVLHDEWPRYRRYGRPLSMIMIDIDKFKTINDAFGHQKGDSVLRTLGRIILDNIRSTDHACRYGGEELAIIMPETTLMQALISAEKLRLLITATMREIESIELTVSLGVSAFTRQGISKPEGLISAADQALYRAKQTGGNRCESANA
jgi:diguanylate cyclase (GGDEF)-like protein